MKTKILIAGVALLSLFSSVATAEDSLQSVSSALAQPMAQSELAAVEGKTCPSLCIDPKVIQKCTGCGTDDWIKFYVEYFDDRGNRERFFADEYNQLLFKQLDGNMDRLIGYVAALSQFQSK
jgi:hypothetical protein